MDISEKLNELVLKFHISDCVPQYQKYLKSREVLLAWMKENQNQNIVVIGRKSEVEYFHNIITEVNYGQLYYKGMFENIEEAQERLEGLSQRRHGKFAIFERIRSEVITKLN